MATSNSNGTSNELTFSSLSLFQSVFVITVIYSLWLYNEPCIVPHTIKEYIISFILLRARCSRLAVDNDRIWEGTGFELWNWYCIVTRQLSKAFHNKRQKKTIFNDVVRASPQLNLFLYYFQTTSSILCWISQVDKLTSTSTFRV